MYNSKMTEAEVMYWLANLPAGSHIMPEPKRSGLNMIRRAIYDLNGKIVEKYGRVPGSDQWSGRNYVACVTLPDGGGISIDVKEHGPVDVPIVVPGTVGRPKSEDSFKSYVLRMCEEAVNVGIAEIPYNILGDNDNYARIVVSQFNKARENKISARLKGGAMYLELNVADQLLEALSLPHVQTIMRAINRQPISAGEKTALKGKFQEILNSINISENA